MSDTQQLRMSLTRAAQRLRAEMLSWPDVSEIYGPSLMTTERPRYSLSVVFRDGREYDVQIGNEHGE